MMKIPHRETPLKLALNREINEVYGPTLFTILHQDVRRSGIPDLSVHGRGRDTWWEIKHGTPHFKSRGIQEYMAMRLAESSYCRYIIFLDVEDAQYTAILHPRDVIGKNGHVWPLDPSVLLPGHNFSQIAEIIDSLHRRKVD